MTTQPLTGFEELKQRIKATWMAGNYARVCGAKTSALDPSRHFMAMQ